MADVLQNELCECYVSKGKLDRQLQNPLSNSYWSIKKVTGAWLKQLLETAALFYYFPHLLADRYQLTNIIALSQFPTTFFSIRFKLSVVEYGLEITHFELTSIAVIDYQYRYLYVFV